MSKTASVKLQHVEKAISKIHEKPVVTIDFTQHQLEDGGFISTQERVVKDVCPSSSKTN